MECYYIQGIFIFLLFIGTKYIFFVLPQGIKAKKKEKLNKNWKEHKTINVINIDY